MASQKRELLSPRITFRGNLRSTRHGWLRLTPAYSVELVRELVAARSRPDLPVLDPFCGTGTTLTACAEQGIACHTVDINPFLRWLAEAKSRPYTAADLNKARALVTDMARAAAKASTDTLSKNGVKVYEPSAAMRTDFERVSRTLIDEWSKRAGADGERIVKGMQ